MLLLLSTCNSKYPSRRFNNIVLRLLLDWSRLAAGSFPYWNWSALLTLTLSLFMRSLLCSSSQIDYWIGRGFPGASPSSSTRSPDRFKRARSLFLRSSVVVISILFSPFGWWRWFWDAASSSSSPMRSCVKFLYLTKLANDRPCPGQCPDAVVVQWYRYTHLPPS